MAKNKIYIPYFISNENFAPAKVFPRIFFYNGTKQCDIIKVQYYNTGSTLVTTDTFTAFPYFDHYSGQTTTTSSLSLLFLNEEPVYGTQPPSQSLFDKYWSNYINLLYDPKTRILRCNAVLPFDVYQNVELNDIIQLRSNYYHLRAINDYNLRTGECRLELLGPLLEGSMDNITFFDTTCLTASVISNVTNDTGSRVISFNITGSNCCNNPNELVVQLQYGTGSCPATASNTIFVTIPNTNPASVSYGVLPGGVNCVTMSVANYCFGSDTGSFSFVFSGSLSGSYVNAAISGSATKEGCAVCTTASVYTTIVPQGTFSSSVSQVAADTSASIYLTSVTQSNANTFGSCSFWSYYSTQISASVQRNNCPTCQTGSIVNVILPASYSFDSCSQANAQAAAQTYFNSISQSQANASGSCITNTYYNVQISASVTRNNCLTCQTGSTILYTIAASSSMFTNTCSLSEANTSASIYFAATSQSYANTNATCSFVSYYNTAISASVQKNDCGAAYTGSFVLVELPASYSINSCSQAAAQTDAQNYFNSISQSTSNTEGYCYNISASFQIEFDNIDISNSTTSSIYPLTASLIVTSSNNYPSENSVNWKKVGYFSQSLALNPTQYVWGWISGSGNTAYIKVRTKNGNKVNIAGPAGNETYILTASLPVGEPYDVQVLDGRIVTNKLTSSISVESMEFNLRNPDTSKVVTASIMYSTSSLYPNFTSSNWDLFGYSFTTGDRTFAYSASRNGVNIISRATSYYNAYNSGNYIYVKLQSGSVGINIASVIVQAATGSSLTSSLSASMAQLEINAVTSSDANVMVINVSS